jgi:anti-repressor protein
VSHSYWHRGEAGRFESWVCDEVLPSVRKTGSHALHTPQIPQTYPEALRLAADECEKRLAAEVKVLEMQPKGIAKRDTSRPTSP